MQGLVETCYSTGTLGPRVFPVFIGARAAHSLLFICIWISKPGIRYFGSFFILLFLYVKCVYFLCLVALCSKINSIYKVPVKSMWLSPLWRIFFLLLKCHILHKEALGRRILNRRWFSREASLIPGLKMFYALKSYLLC